MCCRSFGQLDSFPEYLHEIIDVARNDVAPCIWKKFIFAAVFLSIVFVDLRIRYILERLSCIRSKENGKKFIEGLPPYAAAL